MPDKLKLDPTVEKFMISKGFRPAPLYWTQDKNPQPDSTLKSWQVFRRIEDGDKLTPYSVNVHFALNIKGQPMRADFRAVPLQTGMRYGTVTLKGRNKILVHFDHAVDILTNLQNIFCNHEGREQRLKPLADAIYRQHAT